jgi:hypothetical protein
MSALESWPVRIQKAFNRRDRREIPEFAEKTNLGEFLRVLTPFSELFKCSRVCSYGRGRLYFHADQGFSTTAGWISSTSIKVG